MRFFPPSIALGACVAFAASCFGIAGGKEPAETIAAPFSGHTLFDGESLHGWNLENQCKASARHGELLLEEGNGWLRSDLIYTDFSMHLEWKALKEHHYDAGIYIRTPAGGSPFPAHGYQINLLEGKEGNIGTLKGAMSTGLVKPGQWNIFDITAVGSRVTLLINGQQAYDVDGLTTAAGHIGFQIEVPMGGQFLIRNVRIHELSHQSLLNGRDMTGWEGADRDASACWRVHEGVLECDGRDGPWLRSLLEYEDFNLRLEYSLDEGGNSGIFIRVPRDGTHHRAQPSEPPAGFEVQLLDDRAKQYDALKDFQYGASIYDICGARQKVGRAAGAWNSLEINCIGNHITTTHNGIRVVDVTPESHPAISLRKTKGFLGLQNHKTTVRVRAIRIGPPLPDQHN